MTHLYILYFSFYFQVTTAKLSVKVSLAFSFEEQCRKIPERNHEFCQSFA